MTKNNKQKEEWYELPWPRYRWERTIKDRLKRILEGITGNF